MTTGEKHALVYQLSGEVRRCIKGLATEANRRRWEKSIWEDVGCIARKCDGEGCVPDDCQRHQGRLDGRPLAGVIPWEWAVEMIEGDLFRIQWLFDPPRVMPPTELLRKAESRAKHLARAATLAPGLADLAAEAAQAATLANRIRTAIIAAGNSPGRPKGQKKRRQDGIPSLLARRIAAHLSAAGIAVHPSPTSDPAGFLLTVDIVKILFPAANIEALRGAINR